MLDLTCPSHSLAVVPLILLPHDDPAMDLVENFLQAACSFYNGEDFACFSPAVSLHSARLQAFSDSSPARASLCIALSRAIQSSFRSIWVLTGACPLLEELLSPFCSYGADRDAFSSFFNCDGTILHTLVSLQACSGKYLSFHRETMAEMQHMVPFDMHSYVVTHVNAYLQYMHRPLTYPRPNELDHLRNVFHLRSDDADTRLMTMLAKMLIINAAA